MQTKLTLRMDENLVRKAKRFSKKSGKSISGIVSDYFSLIDAKIDSPMQISPRVRSLLGAFSGPIGEKRPNFDEEDYRSHLEDKYL